MSVDSNNVLRFAAPIEDPWLEPLGFTTASPQTWGESGSVRILFTIAGEVFVFSQTGELIDRQKLPCSFNLEGGLQAPPLFDFDILYWSYFLKNGPHAFDSFFEPLVGMKTWLDPTVAIIEKVGRDKLRKPIVVAASNNCGVFGYELNPPPQKALTNIWKFGNLFVTSSPAIAAGTGEVVFGTDDGRILALDVRSGKQLWSIDVGDPALGTPAILGGVQIFAASSKHVYLITSGNIDAQATLPAPTVSSPALSWDRLYITTQLGTYSHNFGLSGYYTDATWPSGASSPSIGHDGTVYVLSGESLRAYEEK